MINDELKAVVLSEKKYQSFFLYGKNNIIILAIRIHCTTEIGNNSLRDANHRKKRINFKANVENRNFTLKC